MPDSPGTVIELVARWQELQEQGQSVALEELCSGRPELVAELQRHIAGLASLQAFLGLEPAAPTTQPPRSNPEATANYNGQTEVEASGVPGGFIAGHEILGVLGRGGMGVVYKARQVALKRLVALKMILAGQYAGPAELARFRVEGEAVARLQHPHIVQIHEIGVHEERPFFSLEYVAGGSLAQKIQGTPQPPRDAAQLVERLAQAMHHAHQQSVIHRDLKPANVLLTEDGLPKITDFGLAKQLDDEGQTQSGAVMGTPSYMAPEQAAGQIQQIGPATDVYALGAILYELLTGRPPFQGASIIETLDQVKQQEPVPPTQLQPKVPKDLETICLKCLHKEAQRRYDSAAELAEDLRRYLEDRPILARPVGRVGRLLKWGARDLR